MLLRFWAARYGPENPAVWQSAEGHPFTLPPAPPGWDQGGQFGEAAQDFRARSLSLLEMRALGVLEITSTFVMGSSGPVKGVTPSGESLQSCN